MNEFDLIERYFRQKSAYSHIGVGDDAALLKDLPIGMKWAICTDVLVQDRHFLSDVNPFCLGHKALAVNLSDLAAMGAQARAFTLSLVLPEANPSWLEPFSKGLLTLAQQHDCELIGGDTTQGPLTVINITALGYVPLEQALRRDRAQIKDDIWVSGDLGDAAWALKQLKASAHCPDDMRLRLEQPTPRLALGQSLRGIAHACLDISDGLAGDLLHILKASDVGACIELSALPLSAALQACPRQEAFELALSGGDDYELLFTAPAEQRAAIASLASALALRLTRIGCIEKEKGLRFTLDGTISPHVYRGYNHFI